MIHIEELVDQRGFEFWFTKGISYSDLQELFIVFKKYSISGEETDMSLIMNSEFFPSTKRYENKYRRVFVTKEELDNILSKSKK